MTWQIFICSTGVVIIGLLVVLFCKNTILQGIGMSIIAAYIFYIPLELVPSVMRDREKLPSKVVAYRKLQGLLSRLDGMFISPYVKSIDPNAHSPKLDDKITLTEFYNPDFMASFMTGFDLLQDSYVHNIVNLKPFSFREFLSIQWRDIRELSNSLLQLPIVQEDSTLAFHIEYLISDSMIKLVLEDAHVNNFAFESLLSLNQKGIASQKLLFDRIIKLHEIAFKYYDELKHFNSFSTTISPPIFYPKKSTH